MNVIGISGYLGHDASAALLVNGQVIAAAQEERFTRVKHDMAFPHLAIEYCLSEAGLDFADITNVVFTEKPFTARMFYFGGYPCSLAGEKMDELITSAVASPFHRKASKLFPAARFHAVQHHETHITVSHLLSGFSSSAFLCVDGKGENYCATIGRVSTGGVEILDKHAFENGLGMFYSIVTHFLGFLSFGDEYKLMGLAPYGEPVFTEDLAQLYTTTAQGQLRLKSRHQWSKLDANLELAGVLGFPMRMPEDPVEDCHRNVAASIQKIFEQEVLKLAQYTSDLAVIKEHLIFTGGCAQNCAAAGTLLRSGIFEDVFVSPVASDMSSALGAAVHFAHEQGESVSVESFRSLYLGPEAGEVPEQAQAHQISGVDRLYEYVAQQLSEGYVVGWVQGRMELGPRALGARSILADPRAVDAKDKLNRKIKFREGFRPFAPAIMAERVSEWFDFEGRADYMNLTAPLLLERRQPQVMVPGVIHVDFTARLQTVHAAVHQRLYLLLKEFERITGVPILMNTSFNLAGAPIVCSAQDAWETFVQCDIDLLVIGNEIFKNPRTHGKGMA